MQKKKKSATFLSDKSSGKISIEGSSSISPIMQKLIDGYRKYNENVQIALTTSDSSSGLNAAIRGECDWEISSRTLKVRAAVLAAFRVHRNIYSRYKYE